MNRRPVFITGAIFNTGLLAGACFFRWGWLAAVAVVTAGVIGFTFGWRAQAITKVREGVYQASPRED